MKKILFFVALSLVFIGCTNSGKESFVVSGKVVNNTGKMVYLEEVPIGTMRASVVDSAQIKSDGGFKLKTAAGESAIFNIRIDNSMYPVASVINDNPSVEITITMSKEHKEFADDFKVEGSPASQNLQGYMKVFDEKMQAMFAKKRELDSVRSATAPDSVLNVYTQAAGKTAVELKDFVTAELKKSENPALTMFELGYYQSTASNASLGLQPLADELVTEIIDNVFKKNPNHTGLALVKKSLASQAARTGAGAWVGKEAPDFTLPDVDGKPVALSSLKGKYVLVDFWASWCKPCRMENPNVVAAYNKYKNKNFTILGVSLDENRDSWLEAIKKDQLAWRHVSDLKQWNSLVLPLYQFDGIPYNVLLDPQGKVIAESLRGSDLEAKLAEVLTN